MHTRGHPVRQPVKKSLDRKVPEGVIKQACPTARPIIPCVNTGTLADVRRGPDSRSQ